MVLGAGTPLNHGVLDEMKTRRATPYWSYVKLPFTPTLRAETYTLCTRAFARGP